MASICLIFGVTTILLGNSFTLGWNHSVEKILWEEHYCLENNQLILETARVRGTGAGMEIPGGAVFKNGAWEYRPKLIIKEVRLTHSQYTTPYVVCKEGDTSDKMNCQTLPQLMPNMGNGATVKLTTCEQ